MNRLFLVASLFVLLPAALLAGHSPCPPQEKPGSLSPFRNARFVYVTSFDGSSLSANVLPEDRQAIVAVHEALQKLGHFTFVLRPEDADMIVAVESRSSEDILSIYDRRSWRTGAYLWRATAKAGLSGANPPLVQQFEEALAKVKGTPIT